MLRNLLKVSRRERIAHTFAAWTDWSLQFVLWTVWTLVVVAVGYFNWRADVLAQHPINTLGLVIHCVVAGVIGLVVMTMIEIRLEPWRFLDK